MDWVGCFGAGGGSECRLPVELGVKLACGFEMLYQSGLRNIRRHEKTAAKAAAAEAGTAAVAAAEAANAAEVAYMEELRRAGFLGGGGGSADDEQQVYAASCWEAMVEETELNAAMGGVGTKAGADAGRGNSRSVHWARRLERGLAAAERLEPDELVGRQPETQKALLEFCCGRRVAGHLYGLFVYFGWLVG